MTIPNPLDAIEEMITDEAVRAAQGSAPLSSPPVLSDFPYVVLWSNLPAEESGGGPDAPTLADEPDSLRASIRITYAASSISSLYWLINRVRPLLDRQTPVIDGYHVERLRLRSTFDEAQDRTIQLEGGRHPIYAVDSSPLIAQKLKE